jgi:catechol 2,3-dioxygenase-like lactoylglutathione lyase family enzyme
MQLKRIDHLVITVKNVKAAVEFYTKVLNMQELTVKSKDIELKFQNIFNFLNMILKSNPYRGTKPTHELLYQLFLHN